MAESAVVFTHVADFDGSDDFTKKHTPYLTSQRDGDVVVLSVEVGHEVAHPNQPDHYITFVELYADKAPIARFDFFPGVSWPTVSVACTLPAGTVVTALEHCNLHGVWTYEHTV